MASKTNNTTLYCDYSSSNSWRLTATITENSVGTSSQNTSNVTVTATLTSIQGSFSTGANNTLEVWFYNNSDVPNGVLVSQKVVNTLNAQASVTATGTFDTPHKDDGTLTGYVIAKWTKASTSSYPPNSGSVNSGTLTFTTIPRYINITRFNPFAYNSTGIKTSWGVDASWDTIQYSLNNGSWTNAPQQDDPFTITGLNANTTYNLKIRVKSTASGLWTPTDNKSVKTYKTPTQSVSSKSETKITMNWSCDATADYVWYKVGTGSWVQVGSVNATSGTYSISGLTPNNTYNIYTRVKRSSTQATDDTAVLSVLTYKDAVFSLKSKTEKSFTFNWSADSTLSKIEYRYKLSSASSYGSWTNASITAGTSGTLSINNLTNNSTYNIQFRTTRQATSTETRIVDAVQTQTTYQYPYVKTVGSTSLTAGNSQTLTIFNPLGRTITVYMKKDSVSGTQLYYGTTNTASENATFTFTPTKADLYNSVTNAKSGNAKYYCNCSENPDGYVSTYVLSGTYQFGETNSDLTPTLNTTEWSYTANQTSLTNNNQVVIKDNSTIEVSVTTSASNFKYNAGIKSIKVECGSKSNTLTTSTTTGTNTVSVANVDGNIIKVTLTDTRNYPITSQLDISNNFVEYFIPNNSKKETHRESGVSANTTLTLKGELYKDKFGSVGQTNTFTEAQYYTSTDNSTWSGPYTIPTNDNTITYDGNKYELTNFQIHANGTSGGFTVGQRYYLKVALTDMLQTITLTDIIVTDGKLALDVYQDSNGEYHRGINGLADSGYALKIYGNVTATGQFRKNHGGSFIQDRDLAVVRNNNASSSASYNPVISAKTADGNWTIGQYNGENLYFNYTTDSDYSNNNNKSRKIRLGIGTIASGANADILHSNNTSYTGTYTEGIKNGTIKINETATDMYCRGTVYQKLSNPSSTTHYYPLFSNSLTNNVESWARVNNGIEYETKEGTASATGYGELIVGNTIASGTAGNKRGYINIKSTSRYGSSIFVNGALTADRSLYIPDHSGTIQVIPTNLYNNTSGGTNGTVTLSSSSANFTYLDIYFRNNGGNNYVSFQRVYSPNGKTTSLFHSHPVSTSNSTTYFKSKEVKISGTSITNVSYAEPYIGSDGASFNSQVNNIYIVRVDGWV